MALNFAGLKPTPCSVSGAGVATEGGLVVGVGAGAPTIAVWATVTVAEIGVLRVVSVAVMTVVPTALEAVTVAV